MRTLGTLSSLPLPASLALLILLLLASAPALAAPPQPNATALPRIDATADGDGHVTPAFNGCGGEVAAVINAGFEEQVIVHLNHIRAEHDLPPLKRVEGLDQAARYHAADMAQDNYFSHDSQDQVGGVLVAACKWNDRVAGYYSGATFLSENIAAGYGTPAQVMQAWMDSPGHRANILATSSWEVGVGYHEGHEGSYGRYWVLDFGRRQDVYPVVVDREASRTESGDITVYAYGDWEEMRLRVDDGPWSAWQPFQAAFTWRLTGEEGTHTVWVERRRGYQGALAGDDIYLARDVEPAADSQTDRVYVPLVQR
jgi:uncharacterized protein YkwD